MIQHPSGGVPGDKDDHRRLEAALADRESRLRWRDEQLVQALTDLTRLEPVATSRVGRLLIGASEMTDRLRATAAPWLSNRARVVRRARHLRRIAESEGLKAPLRRVHARWTRRGLDGSGSGQAAEDGQYAHWLRDHAPSRHELDVMSATSAGWSYRPVVSILVPVYNPEATWLEAMINSVLRQTYDRWELCLADDSSTRPETRGIISAHAARDARIKALFRTENGNIAAASASALETATGEFVALLDHDDVLREHALFRVVEMVQRDRAFDLIYSDEDKILMDGTRGHAHFKGEFDPDYLLSTNYVGHLTVARRDLVTAAGGFRPGFDGSQDHDLVLRVSERARRIGHVADVLYSWRQVPGSAALGNSEKPAAWEAGRRAVDAALRRRGLDARAELGPAEGLYVARYPVPDGTTVTAIVMAGDPATAARSLKGLRRGARPSAVKWIVVGHDAALGALQGQDVEVVVARGSAQYARLLNELSAREHSDVIVLVSGDLVPAPTSPDWLTPLVEQAMRESVGVAGGRVTDMSGKPEVEGIRLDREHVITSTGLRWPVIQRVAAVTADCMAVRRNILLGAGGFDERYRLALFDVDLCTRLRRDGLATVYTPLPVLRRLRPQVPSRPPADDIAQFRACWETGPEWHNPFVSPWLEQVRPLRMAGYA